VVIGVGVGFYLLWTLHEVGFLLILGILLATSIEPLVNRLRRGPFTRGTGVLAVYTAIIVAIGLPTLLLAPSVAAQADAFAETIPERIGTLRPYAAQLRPKALQDVALGAIDRVREAVRNPAPTRQEDLVEVGTKAAHTLLGFLSVFFIAFYWLVERARIKRVLLRLVPTRHARGVNTVWLEVEEKLGGWVRGQLLVMLAMAIMAGIGFFVIGLPNPILLGVLAGLGELVPMVGPFLAFAPAVLVALTIDPYTALIVVVFAIVVQQIESNILVPRIMGHTVGVSPLTVMLGILVGAVVYGLPGAFLAVPVAGAIQVILAYVLGLEDPVQAEAHSSAAQAPAAPTPSPPAKAPGVASPGLGNVPRT
jgi:predicted PurR-regulated permease PerM